MTGLNGTGKTVVINIIKSIIENNHKELLQYEFHTLQLNREIKGKSIKESISYKALKDAQGESVSLKNILKKENPKKFFKHLEENFLMDEDENSISIKIETNLKPKHNVKILRQEFDQKLLHLPTFRIIEKDLLKDTSKNQRTYNYIENHVKPLSFSMKNTVNKIDGMCKLIQESTISSFKTISSGIVKGMLNGKEDTAEEEKIIHILQEKLKNGDLDIIFNRLANEDDKNVNLSHSDILGLTNLISEGKGTTQLNMILYKLVIAYEKQQLHTDKLKIFFRMVNGYLQNKSFAYDDNLSKWHLIMQEPNSTNQSIPVYDENNNTIELDKLSSGEQQIIFIFCEIFLSDNKNTILLLDEPEMSLSVEWQEEFMSDIIKNTNYDLILVATHSPFIAIAELEECIADQK